MEGVSLSLYPLGYPGVARLAACRCCHNIKIDEEGLQLVDIVFVYSFNRAFEYANE